VDFSRELELTERLGLGDTIVIEREGAVAAFALCHSAPLAEGRPSDELRVLKLVARDLRSFDEVLAAAEWLAHREGLRRIGVRCQTRYGAAYGRLVERGWRVHWTDLRMTLQGYAEPPVTGGVVWSNWEI
jgi:hypothetical protein